jgi:YbbR domain-containing protein
MKLNIKHNIFLKIVSVLIATTLWFIVIDKNNNGIEQTSEKTFHIDQSRIRIINTASDNSLSYRIKENGFSVKLKGTKGIIDNIADSDLIATVDVNKLKTGEYNLLLTFSLPANVRTADDYKVKIIISEK